MSATDDMTPAEPGGYDDRAEARDEVLRMWRDRDVAAWLARMPRRYAGRKFTRRHEVREWTHRLIGGEASLPVLWMAGGTGTGKTEHVWRGIGEPAYRAGWRGRIEVITGPALFELAAPQVDWAELRRLARVELLVLDDLDAAEQTDWLRQHLYTLAHERWERELPTVITTNDGALAAQVGPRVASRLNPNVKVSFTGPDHRRDAS